MIYLGCDHGGFALKEAIRSHLEKQGLAVTDCGNTTFDSEDDLHDLNIFITRLLFCFFAEDTGIFEEQLFTSSIERFTKPDGSDISQYLADAFNIMDVKKRATDIPHIITQFPYVNGGLFSKQIQIPKMGAKARQIIL